MSTGPAASATNAAHSTGPRKPRTTTATTAVLGEDLTLIPDAVLSYVHSDKLAKQRTLLTFFIEVDRTQMTIARLAQKLHAYAAYEQFTPQITTARGARTVRRTASARAWRSRYAVFPRLLLVLTGASESRLERRIADLRSLAASDPMLAATALR